MSKAVKFGGSSVANSEQFKKVKQIILADPDRKYVVTSACGKSGQEDHKVTDLLYLCAAHITYDVSYESIFQSIVNKYMEIKFKFWAINQACDEQSIVIGVNNQDLVPAIKAIYQQFISEERVER